MLGRGFWFFAPPSDGVAGFWDLAHEGRTDFAMTLGSMFLSIVEAGRWSIDACIGALAR